MNLLFLTVIGLSLSTMYSFYKYMRVFVAQLAVEASHTLKHFDDRLNALLAGVVLAGG